MKDNQVRELDKAIFTLLYTQFDCPEVTQNGLEDDFTTYIIYALIEKEGDTCPFKNYSCEKLCKNYTESCLTVDLRANCSREMEAVWREFINIQ